MVAMGNLNHGAMLAAACCLSALLSGDAATTGGIFIFPQCISSLKHPLAISVAPAVAPNSS